MHDSVWALTGFAAAAAVSAAATALALPVLRRLGQRQFVREDVPETHQAKAGTPSMGGIPMLAAILLVGCAGSSLGPGLSPDLIAAMGAVLAFALVGLTDDACKLGDRKSRGIPARYRILLEITIALALLWTLGRLAPDDNGMPGWFGTAVWPSSAAAALGAFVLVATPNAVNLTDGLDGLAAGLTVLCALALALACRWVGCPQGAWLAVVVAGGAAGFLTLNRKPAQVWMGDVGSLGLGAALACVAVMARLELLLAVVGLPFVAEVLSVIIQVISFKTTGRRVFRMSPLHHHFELAGASETTVVTGFWLAGALAAALGLAATRLALG